MIKISLFVVFLSCYIVIQLVVPVTAITQRRSCPPPQPFAHGKVRARRYFLQFICYPPYILVGEKYSSCRNNKWDNPPPICVRSGCEATPIQNGLTVTSHQEAVLTFFCFPKYKLVGSPVVYCDGSRWNSTFPSCIPEVTNEALLSCDFEGSNGLCGWMQDEDHDFDWRLWSGITPSSFLFTGPSYDHTLGKNGHGHYMYVESTSKMVNDTARLISPLYEADVAKDGCFQFFYHMYGKTVGGLRVYQRPVNVSIQAVTSATGGELDKYLLFSMWGNRGNMWYGDLLTLKDFNLPFQMIIEGIRGDSFTSDLAFDDVAILKGQNCTIAKGLVISPPKQAIAMDSCVARCDISPSILENACDCTTDCIVNSNCCGDYIDVCYIGDATAPDYFSSTEAEVKLATTILAVEATSKAASTSATSEVPMTSTIPTTKPTPIKSITSTTTVRATTGYYIKKSTNTSILISSTSKKSTPSANATTTNETPLTGSSSTNTTGKYAVSDMLEKLKKERNIEKSVTTEAGRTEKAVLVTSVSSGSSTLRNCLIVLGLALCVGGFVWAVVRWRGVRGDYVTATVRRDPEVQYLTTDVDE